MDSDFDFSYFVDLSRTLGTFIYDDLQYNRYFIPSLDREFINLYYTNIRKPTLPDDAVNICLIHGFAHHSIEMYALASFLAKNEINCHMVDLTSHGLIHKKTKRRHKVKFFN